MEFAIQENGKKDANTFFVSWTTIQYLNTFLFKGKE